MCSRKLPQQSHGLFFIPLGPTVIDGAYFSTECERILLYRNRNWVLRFNQGNYIGHGITGISHS